MWWQRYCFTAETANFFVQSVDIDRLLVPKMPKNQKMLPFCFSNLRITITFAPAKLTNTLKINEIKMAKKQDQGARTTLEEVNESLSTAAQRIEENKKYIYWALAAIAAILLLVFGYLHLIQKPNEEKAIQQIGKADMERMQGDEDAALKDYEKVAAEFSNLYGNRAHLEAATLLYKKGEYEKALKHLEDYEPAGNVVGPASQSLLGDCYVNLKKLDKAMAAYDKAISLAGENEEYVPVFMLKKATVLHEQKKFAEEAAVYQTIKDSYPSFSQQTGLQVEKYLERANALAGK